MTQNNPPERFSKGIKLALVILVNLVVLGLGNLLLIGRTPGNFICLFISLLAYCLHDWRIILVWSLFLDIRAVVDIYIMPAHIARRRTAVSHSCLSADHVHSHEQDHDHVQALPDRASYTPGHIDGVEENNRFYDFQEANHLSGTDHAHSPAPEASVHRPHWHNESVHHYSHGDPLPLSALHLSPEHDQADPAAAAEHSAPGSVRHGHVINQEMAKDALLHSQQAENHLLPPATQGVVAGHLSESKLAQPQEPLAGKPVNHEEHQSEPVDDSVQELVFDVFGDDEDLGNPGNQANHKHVELCSNCQRPREHNRPTCATCGTHFESAAV